MDKVLLIGNKSIYAYAFPYIFLEGYTYDDLYIDPKEFGDLRDKLSGSYKYIIIAGIGFDDNQQVFVQEVLNNVQGETINVASYGDPFMTHAVTCEGQCFLESFYNLINRDKLPFKCNKEMYDDLVGYYNEGKLGDYTLAYKVYGKYADLVIRSDSESIGYKYALDAKKEEIVDYATHKLQQMSYKAYQVEGDRIAVATISAEKEFNVIRALFKGLMKQQGIKYWYLNLSKQTKGDTLVYLYPSDGISPWQEAESLGIKADSVTDVYIKYWMPVNVARMINDTVFDSVQNVYGHTK